MMRRLTIERTTEIILFVLVFALATRIPVDTDTWWHLRSGAYTLSSGMIYSDPFSLTMQGQPWTNHSWGSQILLYGLWTLAGSTGLALYTAALATAGMYFVYRMCSGNVYLRAFAIVLGGATAAVFWSARPQMLSFLLSTVVLYLLYLYKWKRIDRLWLLPPVMAVWGNLHAGFSIGFILMGGTIAGEILNALTRSQNEASVGWRGVRRLIIVAVVSAAALIINPYGLQMLLVPFQTVSIGALSAYIQEWNSPNFHQRETWPFIALLLGTLGAVGASKRSLDWTDFLLFAGTAFMALLAGRNIAIFAVVATPILTRHLDAALQERGWNFQPLKRVSPRAALLNTILVLVVCFGALVKIAATLLPQQVADAQAEFLPVAAADVLERDLPNAQMFNSYNWGGYLMFAAPDIPVFVDGRTDLYGDVLLDRYLQTASGGPEWEATFTQYGIDTVVIEPASGLARLLRDHDAWRVHYEDDLAVIFVREEA